ncbi:hypothetical protein ACWEJ6_23285 [Nonomuraea sp. NPDC004702]
MGAQTGAYLEDLAIDLPRDGDPLTTRSLPRFGELRGQVQQARGAR